MKNLFVVYTPYQMMSALNIIATRCSDNNIVQFVNKNLEKYQSLCEKIDSVKVIIDRNFYHIDKAGKAFEKRIEVVREIFMMKRIVKNASFIDDIDNLFVPSDEVICRAIFHRCRKKNKSVNLYLIDDGTGTYNSYTFRRGNIIGSIFYSLLLDSEYKRAFTAVYCYRPDLINNSPRYIEFRRLISSENVRKLFSEYVSNKIDIYHGKKLIFLDQGVSGRPKVKESLEVIKKNFKQEDILVKKHPRIVSNDYKGFPISNDGLPFEAIVSACHFNDCLIITHSSGGALNPFLIYGERPNVVLLSKISTDNSKFDIQYNNFYERVKNLMGDCMIIPETIEELENFIKNRTSIKGISLN